jgi:hypothetical protein
MLLNCGDILSASDKLAIKFDSNDKLLSEIAVREYIIIRNFMF